MTRAVIWPWCPGHGAEASVHPDDMPFALHLDSGHGLSLQDSPCMLGARLLEGRSLGDKWAQEFLPGE